MVKALATDGLLVPVILELTSGRAFSIHPRRRRTVDPHFALDIASCAEYNVFIIGKHFVRHGPIDIHSLGIKPAASPPVFAAFWAELGFASSWTRNTGRRRPVRADLAALPDVPFTRANFTHILRASLGVAAHYLGASTEPKHHSRIYIATRGAQARVGIFPVRARSSEVVVDTGTGADIVDDGFVACVGNNLKVSIASVWTITVAITIKRTRNAFITKNCVSTAVSLLDCAIFPICRLPGALLDPQFFTINLTIPWARSVIWFLRTNN